MKKIGKGLAVLVCIVGLIVMFGCAGFQDVVVPCHIDEDAADYAGIPITSYMPWTTIWDARRVDAHMEFAHTITQLTHRRMQEDDILQFDFLRDNLRINLADAAQLQEKLFDPAGPIGMVLPMLFGGTLGALFIPRKREKDLEKQLNGNKI